MSPAPLAAPAAVHFTRNRRLAALLVNGAKLRTDLVEAITSSGVALSSQQISTLSFTVNDADVALLHRDAFARGTPVDYGTLKLQVESRQVVDNGGLPALQATCRSRIIGALKKAKGGQVRTHLSPSTYIGIDVRAAGGRLIAQPSPVRASIQRVHDTQTNETAFDVHVRLASELGYLYFEAEGVVYFGKPSWLVRQMTAIPIRWAGRATDGRLYSVPHMRDDLSDVRAAATGTLTGDPDFLELAIPGRAVSLRGMGSYDGLYLVTGLTMSLDGFSPASVEIASPVDPVPQPPDTSAGKSPGIGLTTAEAGGKASKVALAAVDAFSSVIGTPYRWGGNEPGGFDCSGGTQWAYGRAGVTLPRTAAAQWSSGAHPDVAPLTVAALRAGDLVFYASNLADPSTIHHVGMAIGNGQMIAAPHTGALVGIQDIYPSGYIGASRPAP